MQLMSASPQYSAVQGVTVVDNVHKYVELNK